MPHSGHIRSGAEDMSKFEMKILAGLIWSKLRSGNDPIRQPGFLLALWFKSKVKWQPDPLAEYIEIIRAEQSRGLRDQHERQVIIVGDSSTMRCHKQQKNLARRP